MLMWRAHRSPMAWLAIWVLSLAALIPSASRLLQTEGSQWAIVCTATGSQLIIDGDAGAPTAPDGAVHDKVFAPCGYCLLGAMAVPLPPAPEQVAKPSHIGSILIPTPTWAPSSASRDWRIALPRAPPQPTA